MKSSHYFKVASLLIALALMLFLMAETSTAKTYRWTIGAGQPTTCIWQGMVKDYFCPEVAKRVKEATGDDIKWVYAFGGSVAKVGEVLETVKEGILDFGGLQYCFTPTKLFLHNFSFVMPFTTDDIHKVAVAAVNIHEKVPYLRDHFEKDYNQVYLGCMVINGYQIGSTFPWETMEDLKGRKVAAAGTNLPWLLGTGAVPVQSNAMEGYTSLQAGVYEGFIILPDLWAGFKLHEVAPYWKLVNFGAIANGAITINKDLWKSLPPEIQNILKETGRDYTFALADHSVKKAQWSINIMKKNGSTITELPRNERVTWIKGLPELPNERAQEAKAKGMPGPEVMKAWIAELKAAGATFEREWKIEE